ncbi:MAG: tRNA pseudouridine(13) synthase TruD [Candidatus Heimdallarchaeota archaeon]|nr:MAG: tRNA pseudouridine(13) synthase TruD [Candidatus Heimdallarchaeota archaeon]
MPNHSIESIVGIHGYITPEFNGTGGKIKQQNKDFIVREIPPSGKPIFDGSEIGEDLGGLYIHCVLWKSGFDTFRAINKLGSLLRIEEKDFGFAGLKDAAAETYQRISIWNIDIHLIERIDLPKIRLFHPIRQKFAVKIGDLLGNYFKIKIRDIQRELSEDDLENLKRGLELKGVLNFYGPQRFGSTRPILHIIGKLLLQNRYSEAIDKYLGAKSPLENEKIVELRHEYSDTQSYRELIDKFPISYRIEKMLLKGLDKNRSSKNIVLTLPKQFLRLAISSYQSYLFNRVLSYLNESDFPLSKKLVIPLPGYQTVRKQTSEEIWEKLNTFLEEDALDYQSFYHEEAMLRSKGTLRNAILFPTQFNYSHLDIDWIEVIFCLPKGSYGTSVIREITKTNI